MAFHSLIEGSSFSDERGKLNFFNTFDLTSVVRMYEIAPSDTNTIRGWQGHKKEKKWFYCSSGTFIINLIKLADHKLQSSDIVVAEKFILAHENPAVLAISGGYATSFRALEKNSRLTVFSNFSLEESKQDDFRYPIEQWSADWN